MNRFALRVEKLEVESAFDMLVKARALEARGKEILHFEIGEPDFDTPLHIKEAGVKAIYDGKTGYCPPSGIPELREAIAEHVGITRGIEVNASNVVVTPGAKPVMFFALLACVEPGEEVMYPDPGFPIYSSLIKFVGAVPRPIPLLEEKGFGFDTDLLRHSISDKTRLIILNSPNNPTGGVISGEDVRRVAELIEGKKITVLSDEIYRGLQYEGEPASIASIRDMRAQTIILDGFSKLYAMTGWRLGYGIMSEELAGRFSRLLVNSTSCTPAFTQLAGLEALRGPQDETVEMVRQFRSRRDLLVEGFNSIPGLSCHLPGGAFYAFPNIKSFGMSSSEMEDYLLNEAGVASLSGTGFGMHGEGYLRFSYASSENNIRKAIERIREALAGLNK